MFSNKIFEKLKNPTTIKSKVARKYKFNKQAWENMRIAKVCLFSTTSCLNKVYYDNHLYSKVEKLLHNYLLVLQEHDGNLVTFSGIDKTFIITMSGLVGDPKKGKNTCKFLLSFKVKYCYPLHIKYYI